METIILVFSTEPVIENRRNIKKHNVIFGLAKCWINPLRVINEGNNNFNVEYINLLKNTFQLKKEIGSLTFNNVKNYAQIKKLTDQDFIKSLIFIKTNMKNNLPNAVIIDCCFPIQIFH
ncbi:hypothetical protein [Flavobacterium capsici]|uniref:Uncharacterized protein n=1 Tax=Flavobacterium capsici TaxID=3075618 RepID=A0AA96EV64_9FLAO|nr:MULTISPECIES: hypothetical protein [unclassified Flavobacterium]WNM19264.1 hypothetical protein RN608_00945 [Flavobacterium sp. PMR2A8]WNM20653.1 hypothetical protein RN605_08115 [Flavobacterium sp. PMTSA4]